MPVAPRIKNKATKIAFKILGVPANIAHKPTEFEKKLNKRLLFEDTQKAR